MVRQREPVFVVVLGGVLLVRCVTLGRRMPFVRFCF